jgi:SnoaL-like domain
MLYVGFPFFNQSGEPKNKRRNCMRTMILVLAAALAAAPLAVSPAKASEKTDVIAKLKQYVSSFNNGDKDAMDAACAPQASIIDEFPPHAWLGATASADWRNDYETFVKNHGITDVNIPFREPSHIEITGDRAYVVMPTILTYKQHGKQDTEAGAVWTFALQKVSAGWRITGWAWAEGH